MRNGDLLLMTLLVPGTDDSLQSEDLVKRNTGTDVEDAQHNGLSCSHSQVAITGDNDDSMDLVLERVDPVGHKLFVSVVRTSVTKVGGVGKLTPGESSVPHVILDSQLKSILVRSPLPKDG